MHLAVFVFVQICFLLFSRQHNLYIVMDRNSIRGSSACRRNLACQDERKFPTNTPCWVSQSGVKLFYLFIGIVLDLL